MSRSVFGLAALVATLSFASVAAAQDARQLEVDQLPPEIRQLVLAIMTQPRVSPGVAFGSPVGFGARRGDYFFGLNAATSAQDPDAPSSDNDFIGDLALDGSLTAGIGMGDPQQSVGVEVAVNVTSLTDHFADSGAVAVKLHRSIGSLGSLSIGTENDLAWGDMKHAVDRTSSTKFISYSHYFQLGDQWNSGGLMFTFGAGDGRLGQVDDPEDVAPFVSVGYAFNRRASVIIDYAGESTNVAVSVVPWRTVPISAVLGLTDVSEQRADSEFAIGVGYSNRF